MNNRTLADDCRTAAIGLRSSSIVCETLIKAADELDRLYVIEKLYEEECGKSYEIGRLRTLLIQARQLIQSGFDVNFNEVMECEDDEWLNRIDAWLKSIDI